MRAIGEINQALQCCGMAWVYLGLLGILRIRRVSTWSLTEAGSAEMPTLLRHTQPFHACLYRIRNIDMSVYTYVIYCVYIYMHIQRHLHTCTYRCIYMDTNAFTAYTAYIAYTAQHASSLRCSGRALEVTMAFSRFLKDGRPLGFVRFF